MKNELSGSTKEFDQYLESLIQKYGEEKIREYIHAFLDHTSLIGSLNAQLAKLTTDGESEEYSRLVKKIIAATQEYYGFIGGVSEDVRQLLLQMSGLQDSEEHSRLITELGIESDFSFSPLLSTQSIRPKSYIMQVDAITNQLANLEGQTQLRVGSANSQPVLTTVTLDMPDHMRIEGGHALSSYDKSIINGVTSLIESGNTVFSIPMLYHAMTGRKNPTVDDALYEEIIGKLEKMRRMMLTIDLTEENEAHYITDKDGQNLEITDLTLEGYLLPLNKVSGMVNGKKAELFQIIQHPPLYTYSKLRRQLTSVHISLLSAPVNNNATTIPLKTYLLQRIELMKNENNNITSSTILYESIYQELGALDSNKTKKMRIRGYTTTILEYFREQKYIRGYIEYKKGRSVAGVQISI